MAEQRKTSTTECKQEAVRVVTDQRSGMAEAARHLGMQAKMLRRWTRALSERHNGAFPGKGPVAPDQEALHQRRAAVQRLRRKREICKNALGFFANPAP